MTAVPPADELTVLVNGDALSLPAGSTIADVVALVVGDEPRGIAVAVDRCVVPRSEWDGTEAVGGSQVEVVTAVAGG